MQQKGKVEMKDNTNQIPKLITQKKAHEYFGLSYGALRYGLNSGQISCVRVGTRRLIKVDDLQKQIDSGIKFKSC
jgi:hypothetical protein